MNFKRLARALINSHAATPPPEVIKWKKPPSDQVKLNCDASVRGNGFVGIEFVARDSNGTVLGAGVDRINGNLSVACAQAIALSFAGNIGFSKIVVVSDCNQYCII